MVKVPRTGTLIVSFLNTCSIGQETDFQGVQNMAIDNDNPNGVPHSAMGGKPDRELDSHGTAKGFDKQGQPGDRGKTSGSPANSGDNETTTAGGREGQFSDKDRANEDQWSPGSGESKRG